MIKYLDHEFCDVSLLIQTTQREKEGLVKYEYSNKKIFNKCGVIVFNLETQWIISRFYDNSSDYKEFIINCDEFIIKNIIK